MIKVKEESEKAGLKLNIQNTNIMASGPITSWQIDRETVETVRVFILEGSKITADHDCSHEIKSLLHLYAEYIMRNSGLDEVQAGIKIAERNINNLRYADDTTLLAESEEELKTLLMKSKRRVKKLASSSTFRKLRSWHLVHSLHGK